MESKYKLYKYIKSIILYMGTLTVKEILKILNALNKTKKIRRRRRKKKLAQGLV